MTNEIKKWGMLTEPFKLSQEDIEIKFCDNSTPIPTYTLQSLDLMTPDFKVRQTIKSKWLEALEENPKLTPELKFRLISKPKKDKDKLILNLGITDYGVFVATNNAAKQDPKFAKYLMENGEKFYGNKFAYFASPIGNCAIVESSDNKIAFIKRADNVYDYPGFYDTPGGHPEPTKHSFDSKGQFDAIKDEVSEEIGIPKESIEEVYLIGIAVNKENFGKPDMLFYLKTKLHSNKMDINEEVSGLEKLSKDELFKRLKENTFKIFPGSEALIVTYYNLYNKI
ncbi:MAG: NUDIX domain-containing protein [Nanoarchaeota archaeon]|nr:NUDIX domain-containing protein [Nanoarchaeota archaeon]